MEPLNVLAGYYLTGEQRSINAIFNASESDIAEQVSDAMAEFTSDELDAHKAMRAARTPETRQAAIEQCRAARLARP